MYASSWFLTLFASVFPLNAAFRIMDVFICEVTDDVVLLASGWVDVMLCDEREHSYTCTLKVMCVI